MNKHRLDTLVLFKPENVFYATGFFSPGSISALFSDREPMLFVPKIEAERAKTEAKTDFQVFEKKPLNLLTKILKNRKNIGVEENYISFSLYNELTKKLQKKLKPASELIKETRLIKTDEEIKKIEQAVKIAEKGIKAAIEEIKVGKTEIEVATKAELEMRKLGAEFAFETIIASGVRSVYPHTKATKKQIKKGDFVIIDLGAKFEHYMSDLTRTICVGGISPEQERILETLKEAQAKAIKAIKPRAKAAIIDSVARNVIKEAGFGEYFVHSTGHGIGLEVHEAPALSKQDKTVLKKGMVFTVEPGIYLPNKYGARIEDIVVVTQNGAKKLSHLEYFI